MKRVTKILLAALGVAAILCYIPLAGRKDGTFLNNKKPDPGDIVTNITPSPSPEPVSPSETQEAEEAVIPLVVIDAGHGGHDPGTNNGDLLEKDIVLDVALKLDTILKEKGVATLLTRSDDTYLDLDERIDIANQKKAAMFISIHVDYFEDPSVHGTTVHYFSQDNQRTTGNLNDRLFADAVRSEFHKACNTRDRGLKTSNFAVLRLAQMPAVLIEIGFIDSKIDTPLLMSEDFRQKAAEGIASGIVKALEKIE